MKREDLVKTLTSVMVGVNLKQKAEGFDNFVFHSGAVSTFNFDLSISHPLDIGVECEVKAEDMVKVLSKMEGETVNISIYKENQLEIKDAKTTLRLVLLEDKISEQVESLKFKDLKWKKLPEGFLEGLSKTYFSASKDITFGSLAGVGVSEDNILSTDNWRASWFKMKGKMDPFVIPTQSAINICRFEGYKEYCLADESAWLHLRNKEGVIFSCRLLASEDYPFEGVINYFNVDTTKKFSFPEEIKASFERAGLLAFSDQVSGNEFVSIQEEKGFLILTGANDYGSLSEKVKIKDGSFPKKVKIDISHKFLLEILSKSKDFFFNNNTVIFDIGNFKHLITVIEPE